MEESGRIPTYISGLDDRLGGGVPKGHIVLVSGPAGSLKSTLVYRILWHAAVERGLAGLYLSMEQSRKSLMAQMSAFGMRSEEHTSELQSLRQLVCRLLLEKKKITGDRP